jgi:hypothetical protein
MPFVLLATLRLVPLLVCLLRRAARLLIFLVRLTVPPLLLLLLLLLLLVEVFCTLCLRLGSRLPPKRQPWQRQLW